MADTESPGISDRKGPQTYRKSSPVRATQSAQHEAAGGVLGKVKYQFEPR